MEYLTFFEFLQLLNKSGDETILNIISDFKCGRLCVSGFTSKDVIIQEKIKGNNIINQRLKG